MTERYEQGEADIVRRELIDAIDQLPRIEGTVIGHNGGPALDDAAEECANSVWSPIAEPKTKVFQGRRYNGDLGSQAQSVPRPPMLGRLGMPHGATAQA